MAKTKTDFIVKARVARLSVWYLQTPLLRVNFILTARKRESFADGWLHQSVQPEQNSFSAGGKVNFAFVRYHVEVANHEVADKNDPPRLRGEAV